MDTKWKRFSRHGAVKTLAFLLVVLSLGVFAGLLQASQFVDGNVESLITSEYLNSDSFIRGELHRAFYEVERMAKGEMEIPQDLGYRFLVVDGQRELANTILKDAEEFSAAGIHFFYFDEGSWYTGSDGEHMFSYYDENAITSGFIAFRDEYIGARQSAWEQGREELWPIAWGMAVSVAVALMMGIYLVIIAGRKSGDDSVHLSRLDRLFTEILAGIGVSAMLFWYVIIEDLFRYSSYRGATGTDLVVSTGAVGIVTVSAAAICGLVFLAMIRKLKAGTLLRSSLLGCAVRSGTNFFKSLYDGSRFGAASHTRTLFVRQWMFISISAGLVLMTFLLLFAWPLALIPPILEVALIYWHVRGNNRLFSEIDSGIDLNTQRLIKAERMRVDLVTNISHDLKTPLTAIISYVDLLQEEEMSPEAREHVAVLASRTDRLKVMVEDLFDLAKSTSGNMKLQMESLDLRSLIEQTLADMEGRIEESGLEVRSRLIESPVRIFSDGKKLYRVLQNVLDNALKYGQEGTRVFVDLKVENGRAVVTLTNTSGYEMDFTAEEILRRFSRGDRARSTEGSGLGLSIADSFTRATGGEFLISIDGDQFKVTITYPLQNTQWQAV